MTTESVAETRWCSRCEEDKPLSEFYLDPRTGRPRRKCKPCHGRDSYESRQKRPHHLKRQKRENQVGAWKRLGITAERYEEMYEAQGGVCAICGQPETQQRNGNTLHLAVDHCHDTSEIRGLLCGHCNTGLGKFRDDPELLARAISYLGA